MKKNISIILITCIIFIVAIINLEARQIRLTNKMLESWIEHEQNMAAFGINNVRQKGDVSMYGDEKSEDERHSPPFLENTPIKGGNANAAKFNFDEPVTEKDLQAKPYPGMSIISEKLDENQRLENEFERVSEIMKPFIEEGKFRMVTLESLHMTVSDLVTLEDSTQSLTQEQKQEVESIIEEAFDNFIEDGGGLEVKIDGLGIFPQGVLTFRVQISQEDFNRLWQLRNEIKTKLERLNIEGLKTANIFDDYITHITIGYLRPEVSLFGEVLHSLQEIHNEIKYNPIKITIYKGNLVEFESMIKYNDAIRTISF